jgi:dipeptidase D
MGQAAFEQIYGAPPKVQVVHAGLECGAIVSKKPDMEAISFGPLIRGAHTPEEWADIPSVATTWQLLLRLLQDIHQNSHQSTSR